MSQRPRVLIVDDTDKTAELFCLMLGDGFDCTAATSGAEALRLYWEARTSGRPFDLMLLDLAMPVVSGFDVAQQIRESGDNESRIAFMTAFRDPETPGTAEAFGVVGLCYKPIEVDYLRSFVQQALQGVPREP